MSVRHRLQSVAAWVPIFVCAAGSATCLVLDERNLKNQCQVDDDCNLGRRCISGICRSDSESATTGSQADSGDNGDPFDAGDETGPLSSKTDAGDDGLVSDVGESRSPDTDGNIGPPEVLRDPCKEELEGAQAPGPDFLASLVGAWRLCRPEGQDDRNHWLLGSKDRLDFTALTWRRASDGDTQGESTGPEGIYYSILERSNVLLLARAADGAAFVLQAEFAADGKTLILSQCGKSDDCSGPSARLLYDGARGASPDGG